MKDNQEYIWIFNNMTGCKVRCKNPKYKKFVDEEIKKITIKLN